MKSEIPVYLKCYQAIMKHIRPHVAPRTVVAEAASDMEEILRQTKFSKEKYRRGAETFVRNYRARAERPGAGRVGHVENLSAIAPVEIDAIEALMKDTGLLERYPRNLAHDAVRAQRAQVAQQQERD